MVSSIIRRWRINRVRADIETVLLRLFDRLEAAEKLSDPLERLMAVVTAVSSSGGSLRRVYPDFVRDEPNLALALVEAYAKLNFTDADALCEATVELIRNSRLDREMRINTALYIISPSRAEELRTLRE